LRPKESALAAALREVEVETGHGVAVREFLGTISYKSGGRPKIIQFWLMASRGQASGDSTGDGKAVRWLSLNAAVAALTEPLEQSFLAEIGKQHRAQLRRRTSGRTPPALRDDGRAGHGARGKRIKPPAKAPGWESGAPNFIRKFFRRLTNPRQAADRGRVLAG
jgi:hypothetical protein